VGENKGCPEKGKNLLRLGWGGFGLRRDHDTGTEKRMKYGPPEKNSLPTSKKPMGRKCTTKVLKEQGNFTAVQNSDSETKKLFHLKMGRRVGFRLRKESEEKTSRNSINEWGWSCYDSKEGEAQLLRVVGDAKGGTPFSGALVELWGKLTHGQNVRS